jgi:hypothetical protein
MAIDTLEISTPKDAIFRQETTIVATRLRAALIQVISQTIGAVEKSRDLRDHLGLDLQISWQLCKIITSTQPLEFCTHIPSSAQLQRLLKALKRREAVESELDAAETAWQDFERHVVRYAQTRDKFNAMIAHIAGGEAREDMELAHRRSAFEAQRFIWGVETKVGVRTRILHPSATEPGQYDLATTLIRRGLTRFNPHVPLLVDGREKKTPAKMEFDLPLDREAYERYGTSVLPQFCSQAELPLQTIERADGCLVTYLLTETIGYPSSVDLAFGRISHAWKLRDKGTRMLDRFSNTHSTPVVRSVNVVLLHRPTFKNVQTGITRWGHATSLPELEDGLWPEDLKQPGLPELSFAQNFTFMGNGRSAVEMAEVPQQAACVEYACQTQGWNLDEMDVYQCSTDYPLMDSMLVMDVSFDK